MITVTSEEIAQYRAQLAEYPDAMEALNAIDECEGNIEDAVPLLLMRETEHESTRKLSELLEKCRTIICQEETRELLSSGVIAPIIEPISTLAGVPLGTGTAICIFAFKIGLKEFCDTPNWSA